MYREGECTCAWRVSTHLGLEGLEGEHPRGDPRLPRRCLSGGVCQEVSVGRCLPGGCQPGGVCPGGGCLPGRCLHGGVCVGDCIP